MHRQTAYFVSGGRRGWSRFDDNFFLFLDFLFTTVLIHILVANGVYWFYATKRQNIFCNIIFGCLFVECLFFELLPFLEFLFTMVLMNILIQTFFYKVIDTCLLMLIWIKMWIRTVVRFLIQNGIQSKLFILMDQRTIFFVFCIQSCKNEILQNRQINSRKILPSSISKIFVHIKSIEICRRTKYSTK
jgi:hypothetical protein